MLSLRGKIGNIFPGEKDLIALIQNVRNTRSKPLDEDESFVTPRSESYNSNCVENISHKSAKSRGSSSRPQRSSGNRKIPTSPNLGSKRSKTDQYFYQNKEDDSISKTQEPFEQKCNVSIDD